MGQVKPNLDQSEFWRIVSVHGASPAAARAKDVPTATGSFAAKADHTIA
jgi:hypothetical protein